MFLQGTNPEIVVKGATWYPESSTEQQMTTTAGTKMLGFVMDPKWGTGLGEDCELFIHLFPGNWIQ